MGKVKAKKSVTKTKKDIVEKNTIADSGKKLNKSAQKKRKSLDDDKIVKDANEEILSSKKSARKVKSKKKDEDDEEMIEEKLIEKKKKSVLKKRKKDSDETKDEESPKKLKSSKSNSKKKLEDAALALGIAGKKKNEFYGLEEKQTSDEELGGKEENDDEKDDDNESNDADDEEDKTTKDVKKGEKKRNAFTSKEGIIYLGHVPHGFYEKEMEGFFSQFGKVERLRLSRSRKTGKSRGYAFIQFEDASVAKIVQEAMHHYILCGKLLICSLVKPEDVHERMFFGPRRFVRPDLEKKSNAVLNKERTLDEKKKRNARFLSRRNKQLEKLKSKGITL